MDSVESVSIEVRYCRGGTFPFMRSEQYSSASSSSMMTPPHSLARELPAKRDTHVIVACAGGVTSGGWGFRLIVMAFGYRHAVFSRLYHTDQVVDSRSTSTVSGSLSKSFPDFGSCSPPLPSMFFPFVPVKKSTSPLTNAPYSPPSIAHFCESRNSARVHRLRCAKGERRVEGC